MMAIQQGQSERSQARNPFLALLLTIFIPGLGQAYAGSLWRGALLFVTEIIFFGVTLELALIQDGSLALLFIVISAASLLLGIFVWADAYLCAVHFNKRNKRWRTVDPLRDIGWALSCLVFAGIWAPTMDRVVGKSLVETLQVADAFMADMIRPNDLIIIDHRFYAHGQIRRGDVIAFRDPSHPKGISVLRVAALGHDLVDIRHGRLYVNGRQLEGTPWDKIAYAQGWESGQEGAGAMIPAGQYYLLGDNSLQAKDSRHFGTVPEEAVIGRAIKIVFPLDRSRLIE